jgi:hypothetical protein
MQNQAWDLQKLFLLLPIILGISALVIVHFRVGVRLLILVMKSIYLTSNTVVFNNFLPHTKGQNYIFSRI